MLFELWFAAYRWPPSGSILSPVFQANGVGQGANNGSVWLVTGIGGSREPDWIAEIENQLDMPVGQDGGRRNLRGVALDAPIGGNDILQAGGGRKPLLIAKIYWHLSVVLGSQITRVAFSTWSVAVIDATTRLRYS
jgi:hypothetical protein